MASTVTQVIGSNIFNEIRTGYVGFYWILEPKLTWANHPYGLPYGSPILEPPRLYDRAGPDIRA